MSRVTLKDGRTGRLINKSDAVANVRLDRTNQEGAGSMVQVALGEIEVHEEKAASTAGTAGKIPATKKKSATKKKAAKKKAAPAIDAATN